LLNTKSIFFFTKINLNIEHMLEGCVTNTYMFNFEHQTTRGNKD